jgi:addiction module RelB/DinJ family antitoxin
MSAPRHPSEHPPGFVPLGDLSEQRSAAAWHLLIPSNTHTVLEAARQAKLDLAVIKEDEHESSSAGPAVATPAEVVPAPRRARPRHIQVFGPEALALANEHMQGADRSQRRCAETLLERAGSNEGYRALPRVRSALKKLETARSVFGNLSEPIGVVSENGQQSTVSKPALPLSCSHIATTIEPLKPSREMTMSTADTYVRARIDTSTKERAADALEAMGLSISDAIRLLMLRIADERRMPFDVKAPNATTRKAIAELEAGKGKRFASVDDLMADLHADD